MLRQLFSPSQMRSGKGQGVRYAQLRKYDVANGDGIRVSLFVSGCTHACPGCFNALYQDFSYGEVWTADCTRRLISYLQDPMVSGLTLLGGEPMQNLELTQILREVKGEVRKPIWIYSGYRYEEILAAEGRLALLKECDVLVDGLFVAALRDLKLRFRGSSNQRIIDIRRSLDSGEICLLEY